MRGQRRYCAAALIAALSGMLALSPDAAGMPGRTGGATARQASVAAVQPAIPVPPFGHLDAIGVTADGRLHAAGWAIDPTTRGPLRIEMFLEFPPTDEFGRVFGAFTADLNRPDIGAAYPPYGPNHGFDSYSPVDIAPWVDSDQPQDLFPGGYDLCAFATSTITDATSLGCARVQLTRAILDNWWPPS
ncbi:MAG TPA: hypothetical protein VGJ07_03830 [Rugosimonospora sp.]